MTVRILHGDARETLRTVPDESVHACITSPPYWGLRSYGGDPGMIGLEPTWPEHLDNLLAVFREVRRVLRDDGICVVNYGDAYNSGTSAKRKSSNNTDVGGWDKAGENDGERVNAPGLKAKSLLMMPSRFAIAMQDDGWILRSMIPWIKPNPMPESVTDRPTNAVEYFFLFAKKKTYFWDAVAVRTPMKETSFARLSQSSFDQQQGGPKDPKDGNRSHRKTLENLKRRTDKQRCHDRRHDGFNDRWDAMSKEEQQAGGANMRNYIFEATAPFKGAHFATFPPAVIEPFILAGTSAKGCCANCGAPWVRVVDVGHVKSCPGADNDVRTRKEDRRSEIHKHGFRSNNLRKVVETTGWSPTCECDGETVRATVLDPFAGSGTTGLVADRLGRDAILVEINPDYAEMARERISSDAPLLAEVS